MAHSPKCLDRTKQWLDSTAAPWIVTIKDSAESLRRWWLIDADHKWITLNGVAMHDWPSTYAELIRGFELPDYFGQNLNALKDCLTDRDILKCGGCIVFVTHVDMVLRHANYDAFSGLLDTLEVVAEELSCPVSTGNLWDRPAIPFHVVVEVATPDHRVSKYPSA